MNYTKDSFSRLGLPKVRQAQEHKKRLRAALILAHQERSVAQKLRSIVHGITQAMSPWQKTLALSVLVVVGLAVVAGVFGPSAYSVAQAQAQETVNRALVRLAYLTDEERAALEQKFQALHHSEDHGEFVIIGDAASEGAVAHGSRMAMRGDARSSLAEALVEAGAASDLRIVSADELPIPGFMGRAGRAFGFKMMHTPEHLEERLAGLPGDIRKKAEEHIGLHEEVRPVSFMVYTNSRGQMVHLGINADDEPVVVFVMPKEGSEPADGRQLFLNIEKDH
jgi:hypothetical protein